MQRFLKRYQLWFFYAAFMCAALLGSREGLFTTQSNYGMGKTILLIVYVLFLAYSIYATKKENFFNTLNRMFGSWWGRQVGADLYISVFLSLALIYIVEGSLLITLLWFEPVILFANLAILPYLILNYTAIAGLLMP
jgi:hypothetical protein